MPFFSFGLPTNISVDMQVKLIIQFKGRELEFKDLGLKLFQRFEDDLKEVL